MNEQTQSLINVGDRVVLFSDFEGSGVAYKLDHPIKGDHGIVKGKDGLYCAVEFDRLQGVTFEYHFLDLTPCAQS